MIKNSWDIVGQFEEEVAKFYGSKFGVATDCCTHAIELCLRLIKPTRVSCPDQTYISVPFTFIKLGLDWEFRSEEWQDFYFVGNTNIIDAAVFWKEGGYIPGTFMCLSFQFQKHLSLGKGGMILTDSYDDYIQLQKMSCDGRSRANPWAEQNITTVGYHYYMTPETAKLGLEKLPSAKETKAKIWTNNNYPFLPRMDAFK